MKSFLKLTKGEIIKLIKSKSMLVMSVFMAICITAMSVVYYFYDSDVNRLINFFFSDTPTVDIFDIMEGDLDENVLAWADIYGISVDELLRNMDDLDDKPEIKLGLINVEPTVMTALAYADNAQSVIYPGLPENTEMLLYMSNLVKDKVSPEILEEFANYQEYAKIQLMVADDYYNNILSNHKRTLNRLAEQSAYLENDGEYNRSINEYIVLQLSELENRYKTLVDDFTEFKGVYNAYLTDKSSDNKIIALSSLSNLMLSYGNFQSKARDILYYTRANTFDTNYLLIPTDEGSFSADNYTKLRYALGPFSRESYANANKAYNAIIKEKNSLENLRMFLIDYDLRLNGNNLTADPKMSKNIDYSLDDIKVDITSMTMGKSDLAVFVESLNRLLFEDLIDKERIFFAYDETVKAGAAEYVLDNTKLPSNDPEAADKIQKYASMFAEGTMTPFENYVRASYKSNISKEEYERDIKPYFEDKELQVISELANKQEALKNSNTQLDWVMRMVPDSVNKGSYTAFNTASSEDLYAEFKLGLKSIVSKTNTIERLLLNTYSLQTINQNELNDKETGNIYGFIFTSRYNLQLYITQTKFLIENDYSAESYVVPEKVGGAYGFMQFVFVLTGMAIVFYGIFLGAGAIAGEHTAGTLKLLLIRPHTRFQVLAAKFFSIIIALLFFTILNYALTIAIGAYWGYEAMSALAIVNSLRAIPMHPSIVLLIYHLSGFFQAIIYASIAMTIGTLSRHKTVAVALTIFIMFLSIILGGILSQFFWYKYFIFNNADLVVYISSAGPPLADMNLLFSVIVDFVYLIAMGLICAVVFLRRDAA